MTRRPSLMLTLQQVPAGPDAPSLAVSINVDDVSAIEDVADQPMQTLITMRSGAEYLVKGAPVSLRNIIADRQAEAAR